MFVFRTHQKTFQVCKGFIFETFEQLITATIRICTEIAAKFTDTYTAIQKHKRINKGKGSNLQMFAISCVNIRYLMAKVWLKSRQTIHTFSDQIC